MAKKKSAKNSASAQLRKATSSRTPFVLATIGLVVIVAGVILAMMLTKKPGLRVDQTVSLGNEGWNPFVIVQGYDGMELLPIWGQATIMNQSEKPIEDVVVKTALTKDSPDRSHFVGGALAWGEDLEADPTMADLGPDPDSPANLLIGDGLNIGKLKPGQTVRVCYVLYLMDDSMPIGTTDVVLETSAKSGKIQDNCRNTLSVEKRTDRKNTVVD